MTRIALAGLGAAARTIHLAACRRVPELELVGGADPDARARAEFQRATGGLPAHESLDALLESARPDWLVVASPPATHAELACRALEHGVHVFCEKPLAESVADVDRVLAAAVRAARAVVVNHEFARMPTHAALLAELGSSEFGEPLFLQAWQTILPAAADESGWRAEGKTLREFGTHVIDLALRVFGAGPVAVTARMPRVASPLAARAHDPLDLVVLEFDGGRAASIVLDRVSPGRHRYLELRLDGTRATLRASLGGRADLKLGIRPRSRRPFVELGLGAGGLAWSERGERTRVLARNPLDVLARATAELLGAALAAVAAGREPPCSGAEARRVVAVVEAAYESARAGRTIELAG
jgi:predicted dehydrogenase